MVKTHRELLQEYVIELILAATHVGASEDQTVLIQFTTSSASERLAAFKAWASERVDWGDREKVNLQQSTSARIQELTERRVVLKEIAQIATLPS